MDNLRQGPAALAASLFNACIFAITMWPSGYHLAISIWLTLLALGAGGRFAFCLYRARDSFAGIDIERDPRRIFLMALGTGTLWGVGIAAAGLVATPGQFNLIALVCGSMMGGAAITYAAILPVAMAFVLPAALGSLVAWWLHPGAPTFGAWVFIACYVLVLWRATKDREQAFARRIEIREELAETAATVQLLLNDFESQASDWLWQADPDGRLVAPGPRLAEMLTEMGAADAVGRPLAVLFRPGPERDELLRHLSERRPFRNLLLPLAGEGAGQWWKLSGRPLDDGSMRGVAGDATAEREAAARIDRMAHYDALTDLANRALFQRSLKRSLDRCRTGRERVALMMLDLDRFKAINDTLGHAAGDRLLRIVADRLREAVRRGDLVARLGGDEFAVVIEASDAQVVAEETAARVVEQVARPALIGGSRLQPSTSIGIALAGRGQADPAVLLKEADIALYRAKSEGRGRFALYDPERDAASAEERSIPLLPAANPDVLKRSA